jgi:hypothetical protein
MLHVQVGQVAALYGDPTFKQVLATSLSLVLAVVIKRATDQCYVEFPESEPMVNVIAAIRNAERNQFVAFDPDDPDLWEPIEGGYRLHGMFREELREE